MRKSKLFIGPLLLIVCCFFPKKSIGQVRQGIILYEERVNMHRMMGPGREDLKKNYPEFDVTPYQLFFKESETLYKHSSTAQEPVITEGDKFDTKFAPPDNELYFNHASNNQITRQEFLGKYFIISEAISKASWTLGNQTKTIAGYLCKQAYTTKTNERGQKEEVTAWFTEQLPKDVGPNNFNGLPGAILAVDIDNGAKLFIALKVEVKSLSASDLKTPTKGAKISSAEFSKMVENHLKQNGGGGFFKN